MLWDFPIVMKTMIYYSSTDFRLALVKPLKPYKKNKKKTLSLIEKINKYKDKKFLNRIL